MRIVIAFVSFLAGLVLTVIVLTTNTSPTVERTCDAIVRSARLDGPDTFLVCEINLQQEDDEIIILERK